MLLTEYQQTLMGIQASASDDCVRILTETGAAFPRNPRTGAAAARDALDDKDQLELAASGPQATSRCGSGLLARNPRPEVAAERREN